MHNVIDWAKFLPLLFSSPVEFYLRFHFIPFFSCLLQRKNFWFLFVSTNLLEQIYFKALPRVDVRHCARNFESIKHSRNLLEGGKIYACFLSHVTALSVWWRRRWTLRFNWNIGNNVLQSWPIRSCFISTEFDSCFTKHWEFFKDLWHDQRHVAFPPTFSPMPPRSL